MRWRKRISSVSIRFEEDERKRAKERQPVCLCVSPRGLSALQFLRPYLVSGWLKPNGGSLPRMRGTPSPSSHPKPARAPNAPHFPISTSSPLLRRSDNTFTQDLVPSSNGCHCKSFVSHRIPKRRKSTPTFLPCTSSYDIVRTHVAFCFHTELCRHGISESPRDFRTSPGRLRSLRTSARLPTYIRPPCHNTLSFSLSCTFDVHRPSNRGAESNLRAARTRA